MTPVVLGHFGVIVVLWLWFAGGLQKCKACLELCNDHSLVWWVLVALPLASCLLHASLSQARQMV